MGWSPRPFRVLYAYHMSSDSPPTSEAWHAELAEKDRTVRSGIDAFSIEAENAALHQRLDALLAELRITRSAVAVRDAALREREPLLREQSAALREQDATLREQSAALREREATLREQDAALRERDADLTFAKSQLETIQATRSWRLTRRAAAILRAPRRLVRR